MNITAFTLTTLAGCSSLLGYLIIYLKGDKDKIIASSLGLATGVMIYISIIDLLPNSLNYFKIAFYSVFGYIFWILFFIIGILIALTCNDLVKKYNDNLYRLGLISLITLIIHNIPEGIITYFTTNVEFETGLLLTISIALHNIPEGISIAIPIYYASKSKLKTFIYVLIASLAEPLGAIISHTLINKEISNMLIGILYALVAGIMVSIALTELLPESKLYSKKYSYFSILIGILIIFISHLLL